MKKFLEEGPNRGHKFPVKKGRGQYQEDLGEEHHGERKTFVHCFRWTSSIRTVLPRTLGTMTFTTLTLRGDLDQLSKQAGHGSYAHQVAVPLLNVRSLLPLGSLAFTLAAPAP